MSPAEPAPVVRTEPCPKRLRAYVGGKLVLDTTRAVYAWADRPYPAYYVPASDMVDGLSGEPGTGPLRGMLRFAWDAFDAWFEEDEEVFTHPRDPHTRVDILPSSRRVRVEVGGMVLAESSRPYALFETGLPTRWYLPKVDVRMDLLTPTGTVSACPYKGTARYWSVEVGERVVADVAWSYPTPLPESRRIAGLVCFWNEKVDLSLDGRPEA